MKEREILKERKILKEREILREREREGEKEKIHTQGKGLYIFNTKGSNRLTERVLFVFNLF